MSNHVLQNQWIYKYLNCETPLFIYLFIYFESAKKCNVDSKKCNNKWSKKLLLFI